MAQRVPWLVRVCMLERTITAIHVKEGGGRQLGLFTELPADTSVEVCDTGFSDATVKVRLHDQLYFVFRQDIGL